MPPTRTPLAKFPRRKPSAALKEPPITTNINLLLDLDHQPELYPPSGAVAMAEGRAAAPIMEQTPRSPRTPDEQYRLAVNPTQFTKALAAEDVRMQEQAELLRERRANLIYGAGVFVAIASLLTFIGAIVFGNQVMDDALTVREGQWSTINYSADGRLLDDEDVVGGRGELLPMPYDVARYEVTSTASVGDEVVLSSPDNLELDSTARCSDCGENFSMAS
ncbi:hypothetical protein HPB51_006958 [Rhipicephalus microplus]|uniref:Uncharacterized protein n=1 Tax=Rhipicephalus microplus TaxID=6941 RepID=A0A9J6ER78_RHIMP|nr:hypothetical protein HPB51_006958 [Rhipicephalus microplus]